MTGLFAGRSVAPALLLLLLVSAHPAAAQDVRHRNFALDTTFRIGCHLLGLPRLAHDSLYAEFTHIYYQDLDQLRQQIEAPSSWIDTLVRNFYLTADDPTLDYTITVTLGRFGSLDEQARAVDQYPRVDPAVQAYNFSQVSDSGLFIEAENTGLVKALQIPRDSTSPGATLMAQGTRFVSTLGFLTGDTARYSRWGLDQDSARFMKVVVAVDVPDVNEPDIDVTDTLLWVELYRRIDTLQSDSTCRCNLYERFRTLPVTKAAYLAAPFVDQSETYREVTFWLDMRGGRWRNPVDSQFYHSRLGDWFGWPTDTTRCTPGCADLLLKLRDTLAAVDSSAIHFPVVSDESDLTCRIFSTRKATLSLLRLRFAMHALDALERGDLDDLLRQDLQTLFDQQDTVMALVR